MKRLLVLTLILLVFSLSACSLGKDKRGEEKSDQTSQVNTVGSDRDDHNCISSAGYSWCEIKQKCLRVWEEECAAVVLKVNEDISSEKLGIKVSYYSNPENKTGSKIEGNRIYFYMNGPANVSDYKSGQYLEEFTKEAGSSLQAAIETGFLKNIAKDKCFVKVIEDTTEYQKAIIDYPDTPCTDGSPAFVCNTCPEGYSRTNGISYFMYYKNQPKVFFYFSIGQYSLMMGSAQATSSLEWFNNVEFIK
jgi:hypothetical protein